MTEDPKPDPELYAPLARYDGERPPAPSWFEAAMASEPEVLRVPVLGAGIEALVWGETGKPGLLLMHGAGAHAGWWRALAPYLAQDYRVAAFSFSGMGGSDWRDAYSLETYVEEGKAVVEAAGLASAGAPMLVGHSFGGRVTARWTATAGEGLKGAVVLDSIIREPGAPRVAPPFGARSVKAYPTLAAALARFRLAPVQPCANAFLLDAVAREALGPPRSGEPGYSWRFDPDLWPKLDDAGRDTATDLLAARCQVALIFGEGSEIMPADRVERVRALAPHMPLAMIPEAGHHLMLSQPLAVVSALRTLFSVWPR